MDSKMAAVLLQRLVDPKYKSIFDLAAKGDTSSLNILLKAANPEGSKLSAKDLQDAQNLIKAFSNATQPNDSFTPNVDPENPKVKDALNDTAKLVRNLSLGDPKTFIIQAVARAAAEALGAGADVARNNGQKRAASNIALNSIASTQQEALHGPSRHARAAQSWGQEAMRRGENMGRWLDAGSNLINKTLGLYQGARGLGASTAVSNVFNPPATALDYGARALSNANK